MSENLHLAIYFTTPAERSRLLSDLSTVVLSQGFQYSPLLDADPKLSEQLGRIEREGQGSLDFWKPGPMEFNLSLCFDPVLLGLPLGSPVKELLIMCNESYVKDSPNAAANLELLIGLLLRLNGIVKGEYGWGGYNPAPPDPTVAERQALRGLRWLNLLGARLVEQFGRSRLLDAPVWKVEELGDGTILVLLGPDPDRYEPSSAERLREYFGLPIED